MRLPPPVIAVIATLFASSLAAQARVEGQPTASAIQPLPSVLVPERSPADAAEARRAAAGPLELGLITGAVVGVATGGVYGAAFAKECGTESDCDLSREYKTMIFAIIGGSLGSIIGAGTSYLLGTRSPPRDGAAPLAVSPNAAGGVNVGVTLRH
jgi:hypothetical protein